MGPPSRPRTIAGIFQGSATCYAGQTVAPEAALSNARAIALMTGSMAAFAVVDTCIKLASRTQSSGQILALTSLGSCVVFLALVIRKREPLFGPLAHHPALLLRSAGEVMGSFGIVMSLALAPLSTVTVVMQAQPLAVIFAAALLLGESVGWRRWMAVGLGFLGVLVILRPGQASFDPNLMWTLVAIVGFTARDLGSRLLPREVSTPFAVAWAMAALAVYGAILMPMQGGWHPVDGWTAVWLLGMVAAVSVALALITAAFRTGEVAAVAPFRYARVVFALAIATLIFGETPDATTYAGMALIVASGLYAFWRERRVPTVRAAG